MLSRINFHKRQSKTRTNLTYKKKSLAENSLFFALLIFIFSIAVSCTSQKKLSQPGHTKYDKSELSSSDRKKLQNFVKGRVEKKINVANTTPDRIIKTAESFIGTPHCMGGTTTKCMDCSGMLVTIFAKHSVALPHNSEEQARYGKIIYNKELLQRGDLVFFTRSYKTFRFITHSGIYLGNNQFIHVSSKLGVTITPLNNPWWREKFIFGTRLF